MIPDPKTQVATQLGLLIIANIEQAALIAQQAAEIERLKALLETPPSAAL